MFIRSESSSKGTSVFVISEQDDQLTVTVTGVVDSCFVTSKLSNYTL